MLLHYHLLNWLKKIICVILLLVLCHVISVPRSWSVYLASMTSYHNYGLFFTTKSHLKIFTRPTYKKPRRMYLELSSCQITGTIVQWPRPQRIWGEILNIISIYLVPFQDLSNNHCVYHYFKTCWYGFTLCKAKNEASFVMKKFMSIWST